MPTFVERGVPSAGGDGEQGGNRVGRDSCGDPVLPDARTPDDGLMGGSDWRQGIWLTARVELPLDVLAGLADSPDGGGAGAGFGQDDVLERQPPGQLRAALNRALLAADPEAAERRCAAHPI
jgi:hypothetical protein